MFIFLYSFDVETLWSDQKYIANLKISICLESGGPCEISNQTVFSNSLLAFRQCSWAQELPTGKTQLPYIACNTL